jgi:PAS domain S-box-containing protein
VPVPTPPSLPYERALAAALDDAPLAVVAIDRGGLVRIWNRSAEALTGWSAAEVLGHPPPYIPEEHRASFRARHQEGFDGGPLPSITLRRRKKDGSFFVVEIARSLLRDETGTPVALLGFLTDVTEQRREEEEQRRAEANLRALIDHAPDGILVHRLGHVLMANPRFVAMLGYEHFEQFVGRPLLPFVHPDDRPSVETRVGAATEDGSAQPTRERLLRADGTVVLTEMVGLPIMFDGQPAVLAYVRDLTERLRLETELHARDRLATVGQLTAAVGHEINNPLAYMLVNLDLALRELKARGEEGAGLHAWLTDAREGAERVRVIVRDLRTFAQRPRDEIEPVDIVRVLDSCIAMALHETRHRARVTRNYAGLPLVAGNEARLGQVFVNVLVNAAHAIPEGHAERNEISIEGRVEEDLVVISVRDTGVGIDPAVRERLFEPFFTTKEASGGTGLGLSICREILASLSGTIALESTPGNGTTVVVRLPSARSPDLRLSSEAAHAERSASHRRVLVVDDEPRVARAVASMAEGEETTVVTSGDEALAHLRSGEVFDVVVCDLMMPAMSGMELYERVRAEWPGVEQRFVFMTGGAFTPRSRAFLSTASISCLKKPFDADQLRKAIGQVALPLEPPRHP